MLLVATLLFILLSPGVLLTLPPVGSKILMSGKTSLIAVLVHAVIFYLLLTCRRFLPFLNIDEGFPGPRKPCISNSQCEPPELCLRPTRGEFRCVTPFFPVPPPRASQKLREACNSKMRCIDGLKCALNHGSRNGTCVLP